MLYPIPPYLFKDVGIPRTIIGDDDSFFICIKMGSKKFVDGFRIAEEDLRLRGAGELLGTRQSGLPLFRVADLAAHDDLLALARRDAELFLAHDPDLNTPRGQALRVLLYLFERDAAIKFLRGG